ncbi:MAG: site-specific integrase [Eubacterium sp.]|nr:site-specific integrase [Eubacterium sp.]
MTELLFRKRKTKAGIVWEFRFEVASIDGKRKWFSKSGFKTKGDALKAGNKAYDDYYNNNIHVDTNMSYADYLDDWMKDFIEDKKAQSTYNCYSKIIELYIKPALGNKMLRGITTMDVQRFIDNLAFKEHHSYNVVVNIKAVLTSSFARAVSHYHYLSINENPMYGVDTPQKREVARVANSHPNNYIEREEFIKIIERFPAGTTAYLPLMIGYSCGLRLGEIFGLVWDDIDFEEKTLTVNRQVQYNDKTNELILVSPKYESYRTIGLDDVILDALKKEKEKQEMDAANRKNYINLYVQISKNGESRTHGAVNITGVKNDNDKEIYFVNRRADGSFVSPRIMQHTSRVIHDELGITRFTTHSLRHTHDTNMMDSGAPIAYIQNRMGHKNIAMTTDTYNHLTEEKTKIGNAVLNKVNSITKKAR